MEHKIAEHKISNGKEKASVPKRERRPTWANLLPLHGDNGLGRELVATGRICAEVKYVGLGFTPWDGVTGPTHPQHLTRVTFAADMATYTYLNFQYIFYSCTSLASVSGLGNLTGVRSMRFMFASCAVTELDFRGFDPSKLTGLYYTFAGCSKLRTMYADSTWALLTGGISGSQCFYSCSTSLVGGNGTVWASGKTAYTYFRIDTASTPGYLTSTDASH